MSGNSDMSDGPAALKMQMTALTDEVAALAADYVQVAGWPAMMRVLQQVAEARSEGRIMGVMKAAESFLAGG